MSKLVGAPIFATLLLLLAEKRPNIAGNVACKHHRVKLLFHLGAT